MRTNINTQQNQIQPCCIPSCGPRAARPAGDRNALRSRLQQQAHDLFLAKKRLIVQWATGAGKSRVGIRAAVAVWNLRKRRILLLVSETAHKETWRKEFIDALGEEAGGRFYSLLTVECYQSLHKYEGREFDLIIADESHHLRSCNRTDMICTLRTEYFLCLSATMSDRGDADTLMQKLRSTFGEFASIVFTMQDAISCGILPEPTIYVHVMDLSDVKEPQTVDVDWGPQYFLTNMERDEVSYEVYQKLVKGGEGGRARKLRVRCTAEQGYAILERFFNLRKEEYDKVHADLNTVGLSAEQRARAECRRQSALNVMNQYALRRRNLLAACKTSYAAWLLDIIRGERLIVFCNDIPQAEALGGNRVVHSLQDCNDRVLDAFYGGEIDSLFAVGMLQEGANLPGIQAGLLVQLGSKQRPWTQRLGRAMRADDPHQHLIVINNTHDVAYLRNALQDISPRYIKYLNATTGEILAG